jgi:hypothetical protein
MAQQSYPVLTLTVAATGTIAAQRFVTKAGAQAGADGNTLGVGRTAASSGDKIPVDVLGTAVVEAGAAVSAGDTIALALEAAGAAGQFIEVLLIPNVA